MVGTSSETCAVVPRCANVGSEAAWLPTLFGIVALLRRQRAAPAR